MLCTCELSACNHASSAAYEDSLTASDMSALMHDKIYGMTSLKLNPKLFADCVQYPAQLCWHCNGVTGLCICTGPGVKILRETHDSRGPTLKLSEKVLQLQL